VAWDFSTEPEFQEHLDWMTEFVKRELWPLETILDDLTTDGLDEIVAPLQEEVKRRGLWAAHLPPELGGQGFGQLKLALMHEILGTTAIAPTVFGNQAPDSGNGEILALAGTPEQKRRFLDPLLAGELRSAFSMTEPEVAGSDPTLLRTRARREDDEYIIDGHKWFSSNASRADFLIVMAVTDPEAPRHQRASMFIVPVDTPGVNIVRDVPTMEFPAGGHNAFHAGHAEIFYDDVRVGADMLLGGEGEGFRIAQQRLGPGRIHHCMRFIGVSRRAFDMLCERATYRFSHGKVLGDHETVQNWIADSAAQLDAARLMTLHAAWIADKHGFSAARREISLIKFFGADALHDIVDRALQVHGALGFSTDLPLEAMYRYARGTHFYDGADELHRSVAARLILRDYEPPPNEIPREHVPTRRAAALERYADVLRVHAITGGEHE
jgi:acyl-CoA dehydrogenase